MHEREYRRFANDELGFHRHSSICECENCQKTYDTHNVEKWCACHPCQMHNFARNNPYQSDKKGASKVATVNFCERCDSMGKSSAMGIVSYRTEPAHGMTEIEICPGCVEDFIIWLKSDVNMMAREKAYKEPWREKENNSTEGTILNKETVKNVIRELMSGDTE